MAAGIVIGVVGLELAPEALRASPAWVPILAFLGGAAFFQLMEHVLEVHIARPPAGETGGGPWSIFGGVSLDLFSDGVLIGTGSVINPGLGFLLALGQAPADIPEGFAAVASLRRSGLPRSRRLLAAGAFALPILLGATLGYWALREAPFQVQASVLAVTGGTLLAVITEEIVPQAHRNGRSPFAAAAVVGGFAVFALVSEYVG